MGRGILIIAILAVIGVGVWLLFSNTNENSTGFTVSGKIVESGTYSPGEGYTKFLEKAKQLEDNEKIYFLVREGDGARLISFEEVSSGNVELNLGSNTNKLEVTREEYTTQDMKLKEDNLKIVINNEEYGFKLKPDEEIYFVIKE